jgi:putative transposase
MVFNIGGIPRTARVSVAGMWYHVLNRGNRREPVFHKPGDYDAFVEAMTDAGTRVRVDRLGYCLMPNHFQLEVVELAQMAAARSAVVER